MTEQQLGGSAIVVGGGSGVGRATVLIEWRADRVALIRDFRYVPYIADEIRRGRARFTPDDRRQPS